MLVILRRHSITADNKQRAYLGKGDPPLCAEGIALAQRQPADTTTLRVYTSTKQRAQQTAAILYPKAQLIPVADLAEMDFGLFEGKTHQQLEHQPQYQSWLNSNCTEPCPNGESLLDYAERCYQAFLAICQAEQAAASLHLVAHGGTIMSLLGKMAHPPAEYFTWHVDPCAGYQAQLIWEEELPLLTDIRYLPPQ